MKLTIEGNSEEILSFIAGDLRIKPDFSGTVKGNFTPPNIVETIADHVMAEEIRNQTETVVAESTKRTRRTKAEMEAATGQPVGVPTPAAVNGTGVDFEEMKAFAQEKAQVPDNVPKIKAKLKEFGVTKTKELPAEHHNAYYVFLQTL